MKTKLRKKRLVRSLYGVLGVAVLLGGFIYLNNGEVTKAATSAPGGYERFDESTTPGIHVISNGKDSKTGQTVELPGEYGTIFELREETSYEVTGASEIRDYPNAVDGTKLYRFNQSSIGATIMIRNAAVYKGRFIDLKMTIDDITVSPYAPSDHDPTFNFVGVMYGDRMIKDPILPISTINSLGEMYLFFGSGLNRSSYPELSMYNPYYVGDNVSYSYEFYDSKTQDQIKFEGTWNFANINSLKAASVKNQEGETDFSSYYVQDLVDIGVKDGFRAGVAADGWREFYGDQTAINKAESKMTKLIDTDIFQMNMERRSSSGNTSSTSAMGILYDATSIARIAPATPLIYGETNSADHTDATNYLKLKYSILQTIPNNTWDQDSGINNRDSAFRLETVVPNDYGFTAENVSNVKIIDYTTDEDMSSLFNVAVDPSDNKKLIITAKDLTNKTNSDLFNGRSYYISVEASPNDPFVFDATAYGYDPATSYMTNYDMGTSTTAYYTYSDIVNKGLTSASSKGTTDKYDDPERTNSEILYNGIPSADPRENVIFDKGTDFSDPLVFTKKVIKEKLIDNVKTNTGNDGVGAPDEIVSITIISSPDTSAPTTGTVVVRLETAAGVITDVSVPVTIAETQGTINVAFVTDEEPEQTLEPSIEISGQIDSVVNLDENPDVKAAIASAEAKGWTLSPQSPNDKTSVKITAETIDRKYIFTRAKAALKVNFVDKDGNPLAAALTIDGLANGTIDLTSTDYDVQRTITGLYNDGWDLDETSRPSPENQYPISVGGSEVSYVFARAQSEILVKFVYADGKPSPADETLIKNVGETVNVGNETTIAAIIDRITGEGYSVARPANETLVVPREKTTMTYTFTPLEAVLHVEFINREDGNPVHATENIDVEFGDVLDLTSSAYNVAKILQDLEASGYKLVESPANNTSLTISETEMTVQYKFEGTVQIITAPTTINFGEISFTGQDIQVKDPVVEGEALEVRDTRSTAAANTWKLKAKVTSEMTRVGDTNILANALHYQSGTTDIPLTAAEQVIYTKDNGGTQNISAGWSKDGDGVKLSVAGMDAAKTGEYVGEITWVLEAS